MPWCYGARVGTMVSRYQGARIPWFQGATVPAGCYGTSVSGCQQGTIVPQATVAATTVPRCHGATVPYAMPQYQMPQC